MEVEAVSEWIEISAMEQCEIRCMRSVSAVNHPFHPPGLVFCFASYFSGGAKALGV